jgi:hypothetical protein
MDNISSSDAQASLVYTTEVEVKQSPWYIHQEEGEETLVGIPRIQLTITMEN